MLDEKAVKIIFANIEDILITNTVRRLGGDRECN